MIFFHKISENIFLTKKFWKLRGERYTWVCHKRPFFRFKSGWALYLGDYGATHTHAFIGYLSALLCLRTSYSALLHKKSFFLTKLWLPWTTSLCEHFLEMQIISRFSVKQSFSRIRMFSPPLWPKMIYKYQKWILLATKLNYYCHATVQQQNALSVAIDIRLVRVNNSPNEGLKMPAKIYARITIISKRNGS